MKRARLTLAPASPQAGATDLTDRLLSQESKPKPRTVKRKSKPSFAPSTRPVQPLPRDAVDSPPPALIDSALAQSRTALAALREAASQSPSRYDIALRFRLDALAHHLQQVAEFVALARGRRSEL